MKALDGTLMENVSSPLTIYKLNRSNIYFLLPFLTFFFDHMQLSTKPSFRGGVGVTKKGKYFVVNFIS